MRSLLLNLDGPVSQALFAKFGWPQFKYERAVGVMDPEKGLVGVALYQNWNGFNIEFSYYGVGTLTSGLIRGLAHYAITEFDCSRGTVLISKKRRRYLKTVLRLGFKYEGTQRCHYGLADNMRNTAVRLVIFRDQLEKLARYDRNARNTASVITNR